MPDGNIKAPPEPRSGNYAVVRLNALKHGVLSELTVLPWENGAEYQALLKALIAEHKPQGPTEEHLVEEVAGVIWRKRRLRLGESAAYHNALMRTFNVGGRSEEGALLAAFVDAEEGNPTWELAELKVIQAKVQEALHLLESKSSISYLSAEEALHPETRKGWREELRSAREKNETQIHGDAASLKRYLETKVLPSYNTLRRDPASRPPYSARLVVAAVDLDRLEHLARYEVHLDRKIERVLSMLLRLQQLRAAGGPG